jgi:hypothetical protein
VKYIPLKRFAAKRKIIPPKNYVEKNKEILGR